MTAIVTAYCACVVCCGPNAPQPTSSGAWPKEGVTVAAPRNVPHGTIVYIEGIGKRVVQDRTAKRFDGRWDVYFTSHKKAKKFGKKKLKIDFVPRACAGRKPREDEKILVIGKVRESTQRNASS